MLATQKAQAYFPRGSLSSSFHAKPHAHTGATSFVPADMAPQQYPYAQGTGRPNGGNGSQLFPSQSLAPASSDGAHEAIQPPSSNPDPVPSDAPRREDNIMNRRAGENSSLYQICLEMKRRLAEVPGFEPFIREMEEEEHNADDGTDPVTSMWNCLRRGVPLIALYNALQPRVPLEIDQSRFTASKLGKTATFKFLQACLEELKFPPSECFIITDLYAEDTTGFVKVTKVVNRVLDILSQRGLLLRTSEDSCGSGRDSEEPQKRSYRQNVIRELVTSERDYVQHLETLQQFKNEIEQTGVIAGDAVHDVFLNLNALLDFQRRFLIRIEQQNSLDEASQNWGRLFYQYQDGFRVYEPFIGNQTKCNQTVSKEWDKLQAATFSPAVQGMVMTQAVLNSFLMKPFQRLTKYPLLLEDLRRKGGLSESRKSDLLDGEAAAKAVLDRANDNMDKEKCLDAVEELASRVEDWKGHNIDNFGNLVLFGSHTVLKGDGQKEVEREVRIIFDALDPKCRSLLRQMNMHVPPLSFVSQAQPLSLVEEQTRPPLVAMEDVPYINERYPPKEIKVQFQVIPEEPHDQMIVRKPELEADTNVNISTASPKGNQHSSAVQGPQQKGSADRFSAKLWRPSSSKRKTPAKPADALSQVQSSGGTQTPRLSSGGSSVGGSMNGQDTPSRKGKSKINGALADFGDKFRIRKPKHARRIPSRPLDPAFIKFYFNFNGSFTDSTKFLCTHHYKDPPLLRHTVNSLESTITDEEGLHVPVRIQYKVYLFERILLCCKEINPNKPKNRLGNNKTLVDKKGKLRLQLKGRIFMQNVTDVLSFAKHGSYFIQIFWKGDPGVENFVIRFATESVMNKWRKQVEGQMSSLKGSARSSGQNGTSETEFTYLKNQAVLENPYQQDDDVDDEEEHGVYRSTTTGGQSEFTMSRNTSSTSLRARSATGGSGPPIALTAGRMPPPRFPIPDHIHGPSNPPLTVSTNFVAPTASPNEFAGNSYFSPTMDSPVSTRSSGQANTFPFPRQIGQNSGWAPEEGNHNTAPSTGRAPSRDGQAPLNGFTTNGRTAQRPSLPAMTASQTAQQLAQSRIRSASSPNIHNVLSSSQKPYLNGQTQPAADSVPVPPIPAHMTQVRTPLNRSQTNSPTNSMLALRSGTQSPNLSRDRVPAQYQTAQYGFEQPSHQPVRSESRQYMHPTYATAAPPSAMEQRILSPPLPSTVQSNQIPYPTQLKMIIWFDPHPSHVTIVVPIIIKHRSLIDRIDSKMEKISYASISKGTARLRFLDSEGDYMSIMSDEDVQLAIEDWGMAHEAQLRAGTTPDFELLWNETIGSG